MIDLLPSEPALERLIKEAQSGWGYISPSALMLDSNETAKLFGEAAKEKLMAFKLIEASENSKGYILTERGWNFRSFQKEREIEDLKNQLLRINTENAKNTRTTFWVSFAFSLLALLISLVLLFLKLAELSNR